MDEKRAARPVSYTHLLDGEGMQTGWLKDGLDWYFLSPVTGAMVVNTVIEGRQIDGSGKWVPVSYTHLDVYKRQVHGCLKKCIWRQ